MSPALLVAMLAFFVALTGTAVATTSALITGKNIKNGSITGADVKNKSLRPIDFRGSVRGPRGPKGASGATGSAVLTGQVGSLPSVNTGGTQVRRGAINGVTTATTSASAVASLVPGNLRARNLTARVLVDVPAGGSVRVELVQKPPGDFSDATIAPTALSCTIVGTAATGETACTAAGPMPLPAGSVLFMRITIVGTAPATNPQRAYWGITVEPA